MCIDHITWFNVNATTGFSSDPETDNWNQNRTEINDSTGLKEIKLLDSTLCTKTLKNG